MSKKRVWVLCGFAALLSNAIALIYYDGLGGGDWDYVNNLRLFVRSAVLHYKTLPLHNPWLCGGMDVLTNPQNHLFSPSVILDLLFSPQFANVFWFFLYTVAGYAGTFLFFKHWGISEPIAFLGAIVFLNTSWFSLHFSEGHIGFGAMQLLPLDLYFFLTLSDRRGFLRWLLLQAFFLLDGSIHTFLMGILICGVFYVADRFSGKRFLATLPLFAFFLIITPKLLPFILTSSLAAPMTERTLMRWPLLWRSLLVPLQENHSTATFGYPWGFHEFGCYFSWAVLALVVWGFATRPKFWQQNRIFFWQFAFWFWTAAGWFADLNPWTIVRHLPILNFFHVQSRLFIAAYLFLVLMGMRALEYLRARRFLYGVLFLWLVAEALLVRNWPVTKIVHSNVSKAATASVLTVTDFYGTLPDDSKEGFLGRGEGSQHCYEPSQRNSTPKVKSRMDPDYGGEIYFSKGRGVARILSYRPGRLRFEYSTPSPSTLTVNTNFLFGWKSTPASAQTQSTTQGLLSVSVPPSSQQVVQLDYSPWYWLPVVVAFLAGCALFIWLWFFQKKREQSSLPT